VAELKTDALVKSVETLVAEGMVVTAKEKELVPRCGRNRGAQAPRSATWEYGETARPAQEFRQGPASA
jgi:hypothetical protein